MGKSADDLSGDKEYAFFETLNEIFVAIETQVAMAKTTSSLPMLGVRLKMASRAMRCALEIYGDRVAEMQKEKT